MLHADSEDSDHTGQMPRHIWVFAGRTLILLVLSCRASYLAYFDRKWGPSVTEQSEGPMDTVASKFRFVCLLFKKFRLRHSVAATNFLTLCEARVYI